MYDQAYANFFKELGDDGLADAAARLFAGKQAMRLFPGVGDGPLERLFNQLSPFFSYQFKNHVLFLGEMMGHPAFFNWFNRIGDYIEKNNRERWAVEHPTWVLDEKNARLIELPWSPGTFIDFGQFSDIQRGIAPLYKSGGNQTVIQFASQFVRLAGANDINVVGGMLNAFHIPNRLAWVQKTKDGYPTGEWEQVEVPWQAPWGADANALNAFWPIEAAASLKSSMDKGLSIQETTLLFFNTMFFGGLKQYDVGAGLQSYYYALKLKDPEAAQKWLDGSSDGASLQVYWTEQRQKPRDSWTLQSIRDLAKPPKPEDANEWLHDQSSSFQQKVGHSWGELAALGKKWDHQIWGLTPGTKEYAAAVLQASTERYAFFNSHPELYEHMSHSKTLSDWSKMFTNWELDDLTSAFYNIKAPKASDFKTAKEWQDANALWEKQRTEFLRTYPAVAQRLANSSSALEAIWKSTEQGWFDILDRVGVRSIALEASKQAKDFDLVDQLYVVNELSYETLNRDTIVEYFDPTTDFASLPKGVVGPAQLLPGGLFPNVKILPDFNKWRWDRMTIEEQAQKVRTDKYIDKMKGIIGKAKAGGKFDPAVFVRELKKDPWALAEYFRNNPGKREQWAASDAYFKAISRYGILMKQGKFDEAGRYFDSLSAAHKARYFAKHPDRKAKMQQNLAYMSLMKRWVSFYQRKDFEGGAAYFDKLPQWAKDRYYKKHPKGSGGYSNSPYGKAMGAWIGLIKAGKKDEAKAYFDAMPKAFKDRYYAKHPDQKLAADIKRTGQLGQYFAADDAGRAVYLKDNPEFAKWLKANDTSDSKRRMLIMAAYRALPKDDQWLRRVYREKYPEIFSQEATGERSLKKTYAYLAAHPDLNPSFEKWVAAIWASYAENAKHTQNPPRPPVADHSRMQEHGVNRKVLPHRGKSAAWVRLHSLS
jgi:hypothetical protein